jgi:hypothetical protein
VTQVEALAKYATFPGSAILQSYIWIEAALTSALFTNDPSTCTYGQGKAEQQ